MSVQIRQRGSRLQYDINLKTPAGHIRERAAVPAEIKSASGAKRWAESRALHLAQHGKQEKKTLPTLRDFSDRWMKEYAKANNLKPATLWTYETRLKLHILPSLGNFKLDMIKEPEIQKLKLSMSGVGDRTRAMALSQLGTIFKTAEEWGLIDKSIKIKVPKFQHPEMEFYDFEEWERLVEGAARAGPMVRAAVLLGGDAGLRRGELVALEQSDLGGGFVTVQRSEWEGQTGKPKGGQSRRIPLTSRLAQAIQEVKHLRGKRLLWKKGGVTHTTIQSWMETACRRAGLPECRNPHKLRHTFISHLAMRGVPAMVIKELAGHSDLATTMRYMHLAKGSKEAGIAALEGLQGLGTGVEQTESGQAK